MPSPSTALSTASVQLSGWSAAERRHAEAQLGLVGARALPSMTRGPAGRAGAGANPPTAPLPVPNAALARPSASSWLRSPATATTVFAGR